MSVNERERERKGHDLEMIDKRKFEGEAKNL
jgi:hypothetical protein